MSRLLFPQFSLLALAGWLAAPADLAAQTAPKVIYACYAPVTLPTPTGPVPGPALVYRIKEPGTPLACLSETHVEFHWNEVGARG